MAKKNSTNHYRLNFSFLHKYRKKELCDIPEFDRKIS